MKTIRVDSAFTLKQAVANLLEFKVINTENKQYADITSKQHISDFIYNVVIEQIYDEGIKQYMSLNSNYHYLNYYNFFMGMRITQNRVSLKKMQYICTPDVVANVRKINYSGDTVTRSNYPPLSHPPRRGILFKNSQLVKTILPYKKKINHINKIIMTKLSLMHPCLFSIKKINLC